MITAVGVVFAPAKIHHLLLGLIQTDLEAFPLAPVYKVLLSGKVNNCAVTKEPLQVTARCVVSKVCSIICEEELNHNHSLQCPYTEDYQTHSSEPSITVDS